MLPMTKGMFPVHIPKSDYKCIRLIDNMKETEMEWGFYNNGIFFLHLYDHSITGEYEPKEIISGIKVLIDDPPVSYETEIFTRSTGEILDRLYPVLEIDSRYFSIEDQDHELYGIPWYFEYGRVIYETKYIRKQWNVKKMMFPYKSDWPSHNLLIPLDLSRREIFENGKMVL